MKDGRINREKAAKMEEIIPKWKTADKLHHINTFKENNSILI